MTQYRSDSVIDHVHIGFPALFVEHGMRDVELIDVVRKNQIAAIFLSFLTGVNISGQQLLAFTDPPTRILNRYYVEIPPEIYTSCDRGNCSDAGRIVCQSWRPGASNQSFRYQSIRLLLKDYQDRERGGLQWNVW